MLKVAHKVVGRSAFMNKTKEQLVYMDLDQNKTISSAKCKVMTVDMNEYVNKDGSKMLLP
ncbi:unnamed protein product [Cercospora beticola]|nr:unnamed protein product [Cercospora beticola]